MSTGYQDFQYLAGVNILGVAEEVEFTIKEVVGVVDVNIESVAGTVVFDVNVQGTVDVNIKSQETNITVTGTVDINAIASVVKIEPSEEAVFEIKPQAGVVFNISGSVNANITNTTLNVVVESGSVDVNVTNASIDVNVTNSVLNVSVQDTVNVNVTNSSISVVVQSGSIDVNVTNSSLNVVVSSGSIDANITNSTLNVVVQETVDVNITNSSVTVVVQSGTIDANITNTSINVNVQNEVDVNITNASIDVNVTNSVLSVSVSGQASVSIDNASVYLNVKNEENIGVYHAIDNRANATTLVSNYAGWGVLLRNVRGAWKGFSLKVKELSGSNQTLTVCVAIDPASPPLITRTFNVPANSDGNITSWSFWQIWWDYDTAFIYIAQTNPNVQLYVDDTGHGGNGFIHGEGGWTSVQYTIGFMLEIKGSFFSTVPVSGTMNTINIPNKTTKVSFSGTMTIVGWVEVINESFIGTVKKIVFEGSGGADLYGSEIRIMIDDSVIIEGSLIDLALRRIARITYSTNSKFCSVIEMEVPVKNNLKIEILVDRTGLIEPHASVTAYYESLG